MVYFEEAKRCRRDADVFAGKPEAPFLLRAADVFEELAARSTDGRDQAARQIKPNG